MPGFYGMDVDAIRVLAGQLAFKADEIDTIATTLSTQIDGASWSGPDADSFRSDWATSYRTQLTAVAGALRDASTRATNNANQQAEVSST
ncbi:WXG100 family type VII secretion target [Saccharothrix yanglingensis]|uniref:WXG100 family type VII secretion target n=1 Tax=Saccharothrix yanglingensis TaxID=659496 RepID=A0ABU0X7R0_9PSEU|nr:hypothetical protein [Saccharothrix yanglingensis]MDQ2587294.1 hypothetical protein [Saccharothrix yanglingensis]